MKTLKDVAVGDKAIVKRLSGEGALKRRIMDMGVTKGVEVLVRRVAPLGDPIEVTVRGYELSLRKDEAANIIVEQEAYDASFKNSFSWQPQLWQNYHV